MELLRPAVFQYLVNIERAPTLQHDARSIVEPTEGNGEVSGVLLLSGKLGKLSKVIPVIQNTPYFCTEASWDTLVGFPIKWDSAVIEFRLFKERQRGQIAYRRC